MTTNNALTPRLTIAISAIDVTGNLREDLGDIRELTDSIKQNLEDGLPALIHPIVLDSNLKLVSGSRRIAAHCALGLTEIDYTFIGVLDDATRIRLEVDANKQKRFNWKETVLGIDAYHRFYSTQSALKGESWGVRETGALLNTARSSIGRATFLAPYIRAGDQDVCNADSIQDAYRVIIQRRETELSKLLVTQSKPTTTSNATQTKAKPVSQEVSDSDFFSEFQAGTTGFQPSIGAPVDLDERPSGETTVGQPTGVVVPLSRMFLHGDAVEVCKSFPPETFDAVITDWPYGNDPEMMKGLKDFASIEAEHQVEYCKRLHALIVPEIYRVVKPNGWFITFTDMDVWEYDKQLLLAAGFKVQRWPLVWHKTSSCGNEAAQYNFTKNYEIAIVARKGSGNLIRPQSSSIWTGGSDAETKLLGHPFAKPAGLWEWVYNACCLRGATVLDPFVGSGSSVIPAVRLGLRPVGIESNTTHFGTLNVNMQNFYRSLDPNCVFQ